jgi:hypothetical protein
MRFFTDHTVKHNLLLMQINRYLRKREEDPSFFDKYNEVLIDPGVYELGDRKEYSWRDDVDVGEFLDSLPDNHYFALDYPCDMNHERTQLFLNKTWETAQEYCDHPQFIVSVQSAFKSFISFVYWFQKYNSLNCKSRFMAVGNLGRLQCTSRVEKNLAKSIILHALKHANAQRLHFYGLTIRVFPFLVMNEDKYKINCSVDSTNWTQAVNKKCKSKLHESMDAPVVGSGLRSCNKETRQLFFDEYLRRINAYNDELKGFKRLEEF